jgi:hypothetical protein
MINVVKKIMVLPVRLLAEITSLVPIFDTTPLWLAAWKLGGDPEDGRKLLICLYRKYGIESARETARAMIHQIRSSLIASTMCAIELNSYQSAEAINKWVKMAKQEICKEQEMLHAELYLSDYLEEYDKKKVVENILSRNDLPMSTTLAALTVKAVNFLRERSWDEAEKIADWILSIQEQNGARFIKWVVYLAKSEQGQAEKHFSKIKGELSDAIFNPLIAEGWLILGDVEKAKEWLCKAVPLSVRVTESRSLVGVLARSEEFKEFCRRKEG